jgi:hypothetical protein
MLLLRLKTGRPSNKQREVRSKCSPLTPIVVAFVKDYRSLLLCKTHDYATAKDNLKLHYRHTV